MLIIYDLLIYPLLRFGLSLASLFLPKVKEGLKQRARKVWLETAADQKPIIIHCSSGEFEYAKPVIREIKARNPNQKVFVSYFSPTYRKTIESTPGVDFSFPAPWDSQSSIAEFLHHHKPVAYLIARTDVWPGMVSQCFKHKIPTVLFSATLASTSKRMKSPFSRFIAAKTLEYVSHVFCVTDADATNFKSLGYKGVIGVLGDTRFDQVLHRIQNPKPLKEHLKPANKNKTIVCGSTWPQDEAVLFEAFAQLKSAMKFIVAPHEPTAMHLHDIETQLAQRGLTSARYSTATNFDVNVLLIDQVGILADMYKWGTFAFVGGSFRKTVHSVMEPLASGCITFFGPLHLNNREALLFKGLLSRNRLNLAYSVSTAGNLSKQIQNLKDNYDISTLSMEIQEAMKSYTGVSQSLVQSLKL